MLKFKKSLFFLGILFLSSCGTTAYVETYQRPQPAPVYNPPPPPPAPVQENPTYQTFYDALAPYGTWVEDNEYGYVWVPEVGPDFQPYQSRGHWVYTEFGWTWVSDYQWGWATFHYGRWRFTGDYGWIWIPGYTWGPAWVAWRTSGDYFGWAPLGPPSHLRQDEYYREHPSEHISIGLSFSFNDAPEPSHWAFVPAGQIASPQINNYYVNRSQNNIIYQKTTIINNVTVINNQTVNNTTINHYGNQAQSGYIAGPRREDVERVTGNPISQVPISNSSRPGQTQVNGNALTFYRPNIKAPDPSPVATQFKPAPKQVISLNQVTPVYNRTQEKGVGNFNAASSISSTDNNPIEAAKQRAQYPNPNFNRPPQNNPNTITNTPNSINNNGQNRNPNGYNSEFRNNDVQDFQRRPNNNPNSNNGNPNGNIVNPNNVNPNTTNSNAPVLNNGNQNNLNQNNNGGFNNSRFRNDRGLINPNPNLNGNGPIQNPNNNPNQRMNTQPNPVNNNNPNKPAPNNQPKPNPPRKNTPKMIIKPVNNEKPKETRNLN